MTMESTREERRAIAREMQRTFVAAGSQADALEACAAAAFAIIAALVLERAAREVARMADMTLDRAAGTGAMTAVDMLRRLAGMAEVEDMVPTAEVIRDEVLERAAREFDDWTMDLNGGQAAAHLRSLKGAP